MEEAHSLKAYFAAQQFSKEEMLALSEKFSCSVRFQKIEDHDWNQDWEKSFQPIIFGSFCGVRAAFNPPIDGVNVEIIITPKMSFRTGHHATTALMIQTISELDLYEKSILDFGCGTGILSILSEKMGAAAVLALDNDDWAIKNAKGNLKKNNCIKVEIKNQSLARLGSRFDCIFANIDRNVLLNSFKDFPALLNENGDLLLSGFYEGKDEAIIETAAGDNGLKLISKKYRESWTALLFRK